MSFSEKKYLEKLKKQEKTNPGCKKSYDQLYLGRSTVFKSKKEYNRQREKLKLKKEEY